MTVLNCPKCSGTMGRRDLIGVEIDQCESCHGIFLDRGELEGLLEAEHRWSRGLDAGESGGGRRRRNEVEGITEVTYEPSGYEGERRRRQDFLDEIFG